MARLSDRVRPNVEAAPWVIEEIKALELARDLAEQRLHELERDSYAEQRRQGRVG